MTNEEWRKHPYYQFDPLAKEIGPALLNSVDIKKYVDKGCLIEEINFDPSRLKTASYEMRLLGKLYDWRATNDGRLQQRCREICDGDRVEFSRNSITYLWMKEKLLLPEYIAARFNLHIRYVHRGILLGTGPLVDPGFCGSLLIPLHNLTNNDYEVKGGEGIIWVEFTKVSEHEFWSKQKMQRPCYLKPFPDTKDLDDPDEYFEKSDLMKIGGVQSAFKGELDRARKLVSDAHKEVNRVGRIGWTAIITGAFVITISIIGVLFSGYNFISRVTNMAQDSQNQIFHAHIEKQDDRIRELETSLTKIKAQISDISTSFNERNSRIERSNDTGTP